jgi:hypothetical protein
MAFFGYGLPLIRPLVVPVRSLVVPVRSLIVPHYVHTSNVCFHSGCFNDTGCEHLCSFHRCPLCGQDKSSNDIVCFRCAMKQQSHQCEHLSENGSCKMTTRPGSRLCAYHTCQSCGGEKHTDDIYCKSCKMMHLFNGMYFWIICITYFICTSLCFCITYSICINYYLIHFYFYFYDLIHFISFIFIVWYIFIFIFIIDTLLFYYYLIILYHLSLLFDTFYFLLIKRKIIFIKSEFYI